MDAFAARKGLPEMARPRVELEPMVFGAVGGGDMALELELCAIDALLSSDRFEASVAAAEAAHPVIHPDKWVAELMLVTALGIGFISKALLADLSLGEDRVIEVTHAKGVLLARFDDLPRIVASAFALLAPDACWDADACRDAILAGPTETGLDANDLAARCIAVQYFRQLLVGRYNQLARIHNEESEEEDSDSDDDGDSTDELLVDRLKELDSRICGASSGAEEPPKPKRRRVAG